MSKLLTIKDDKDEIEFRETIRTRRIYKLSDTLKISPDSQSLPELFDDIDKNAELCGVEYELPVSKVSTAAQQIEQVVQEYKKDVEDFSAKIKEHEKRAIAILTPLMQDAKDLRPDLAMEIDSFEFKDQNGEAKIAARLSVALEPKREIRAIAHESEILE